jgi:ferrous iron transport protein A
MTDEKLMTAAQMAPGQTGVVVGIDGGHGLISRLEALGIRPGKRIQKVGAAFMRGPVVIQVDRCEIAVGFGMAKKITVKTE